MRRLLVGGGLVLVLGIAALVGGYAYYFSGLRTAPVPLGLSSPAAISPVPSNTPAPAAAVPAGRWTVGPNSTAGYRVREVFAGQTSNHEAVARTTALSGGLTLGGSSGALTASSVRVVAALAGLQSVDQVAGFNVANRDRIVRSTLNVSQYPDAVFEADAVPLPIGFEDGRAVSVSVPGRLLIHGVTVPVTASLQIQFANGGVMVAGTIPTTMPAFGISPPALPITAVDPAVTVEFQVAFAPGG